MKQIFCIALLISATYTLVAQQAKPVLNHIAVHVSDLKKSTAFYQDILQLDTIPEPFHDGKHTWFSIGPLSHLHLISGVASGMVHDKYNHLCFTVPSLKTFIEALDKHNIQYESWAGEKKGVTLRVDSVKQIYFQDPDGYWIEVNDAMK